MSATPPPRRGPAGMLVDLSPLRDSPAYRRLWIGGVAGGIGVQLTAVAVGIHVYEISGSVFAVALVGGFALLPMVVFGLLGGVIVGLIEPFASRYIAAGYSQIMPYLLLFLILVFRPHGILAQVHRKKV